MLNNDELISFSADTIIGGLYNYLIHAESKNFQPINANFGVLNPIIERDKKKKGELYCSRSLSEIKSIKDKYNI